MQFGQTQPPLTLRHPASFASLNKSFIQSLALRLVSAAITHGSSLSSDQHRFFENSERPSPRNSQRNEIKNSHSANLHCNQNRANALNA